MSPSRTSVPLSCLTTRFLNSSTERRSVFAVRLTWRSEPLVRPTAARKLLSRKRAADLVRADVERGQPVGLQPDAHGESASAENVRPLHAFERGQARLHDAHEIIRDFVRLQNVRGEAQIGRGELGIGGLDGDDRHLRFRRQIVADRVDLRADFGKRLVRVVIQLQLRRDGREAELLCRLDVIDAVRRRDGAFERRGDEAAHQVGVGADVNGRDGDGGDFAARILPDVERLASPAARR